MEQLSIKRLKQLLQYNPVSGNFIRLSGKPISTKINNKGYKRIMIDNTHYLAHRLAWFYVFEYFPKYIDHKDGNKKNNSISNLRDATSLQNSQNLSIAINNTSGTTGISFSKNRNKWEAKIQLHGKTIHLGRFLDIDDAIIARKKAEKKYNFHKNHVKAIQ